MDITVVLCTYNRCQILERALNSVAASRLPASVEWELLVVDNNSKDQTRQVAAQFCKRDPSRFRYVFEPHPGLSCARNAGVREAKGAIIVFVDDDVIVEPLWLQNLTAALHGGTCAGAGGKVIPEWSSPVPRWLPTQGIFARGPLAAFDLGPDAGPLREPPFGANMAFRKEMFEKYGGFRADLGRTPDSLMSNEDTEFGWRLLAGGEHLRYEPSAVVYHPVQENRMQKIYFEAWWFNKGRSGIRQFGVRPGTKYFVAGIPLYMFRNLAVWSLKWIFSIDPSARFSNKLCVWVKAGEILECYRNSFPAEKTRNCSA